MDDTLIRCAKCKREQTVSFGHCLRKGWPKCCGATMGLVNDVPHETITAAVDGIMAPLVVAARRASRG